MKAYDVAIVGAGPAGSSVATKSSGLGLKTLLIDKRKEIGIPIQCGEYMLHENEVKRIFPNSKHTSSLIELTKTFKQNECNFVRFVSSSGHEYNLRFHSYVIDREKFDKELANRARKNGAEVWLNTMALGVNTEKNNLFLRKKSSYEFISFKVLIAADGFNSNIAKSLGLKTTNIENGALTIQNIMDEVNIESNICEMYWNKDYSPGGYAWIIPKGESVANVGLGVRRKFKKEKNNLKNYLKSFIKGNPLTSKKLSKGKVLSTVGGVVPVGGPIPRTFFKNVLIVGDAAGQVAAHVGGGVPSSVICGEIAGEISNLHIRDKVPLSQYEKTWKEELGDVLKRSIILRKIGDLSMINNKLIDLALRTIGEEGLNRLIRCELPKELEVVLNNISNTKQKLGYIRNLIKY